jgi:hypothetical protein
VEQYGRTCSVCGRDLPASFIGELCAMCRQEGAEAQACPAAPAPMAGGPSVAQAAATYSAPVTLQMLAPHYQREIRALATLERVNAVIWIVIAALQIISVAMALLGLYNIMICIRSFARANEYENLDPGAPSREEARLGWIIAFIFINLFLGGGIGVISCILHLVIRSRLIKIREAFENPQECIDRQLYGAW